MFAERYNSDTVLYVRSSSTSFIKDLCSCSLLQEFSWLVLIIVQWLIYNMGSYVRCVPSIWVNCTGLTDLDIQCLRVLLYGTCCGTSLADDQGMIIVPSEHWVGEFGFNYHAIKIVSVKGLIKYVGVMSFTRMCDQGISN